MTLLFFLRSPAGNTDTGTAPDVGPLWDYEDLEKLREDRKLSKKKRREALAAQKRAAKARRKRKRQDEEILLMFMQEVLDDED